jgi:hypothetical protein
MMYDPDGMVTFQAQRRRMLELGYPPATGLHPPRLPLKKPRIHSGKIPFAGKIDDMASLTEPQLELLRKIVNLGAMRPRAYEWTSFYALERMGLAQKRDLYIFPTEAGSKRAKE